MNTNHNTKTFQASTCVNPRPFASLRRRHPKRTRVHLYVLKKLETLVTLILFTRAEM